MVQYLRKWKNIDVYSLICKIWHQNLLVNNVIWLLNNCNITDKNVNIVIKLIDISEIRIPLLTRYSHIHALNMPLPGLPAHYTYMRNAHK